MDIFLFNPDTDLALAANKQAYTASMPVRQMALGLAALPVWYATPGACILLPDEIFEEQEKYILRMNKAFAMDVRPLSYSHLSGIKEACFHPWGWNKSVRNRLLRAGVSPSCLPDEAQLEHLRQLSSREQVRRVLECFQEDPDYCGLSMNFSDEHSCQVFADAHPEGVVFKSPWSSSGKGLCWCRNGYDTRHKAWCTKVIREQGLVTAQPYYHRLSDFAMEFKHDGHGNVEFIGYSLFHTNEQGAYLGNVLASDEIIEKKLSQGLDTNVLPRIRKKMAEVLALFDYQGYMGVDMMVCQEEQTGRHLVHPCVEMNWRMNMGIVSHELMQRFVHPSCEGIMQVENLALSSLGKYDLEHDMNKTLDCLENGKVHKGKIILSWGNKSSFVAYASIYQGANCTASLSLP